MASLVLADAAMLQLSRVHSMVNYDSDNDDL